MEDSLFVCTCILCSLQHCHNTHQPLRSSGQSDIKLGRHAVLLLDAGASYLYVSNHTVRKQVLDLNSIYKYTSGGWHALFYSGIVMMSRQRRITRYSDSCFARSTRHYIPLTQGIRKNLAFQVPSFRPLMNHELGIIRCRRFSCIGKQCLQLLHD